MKLELTEEQAELLKYSISFLSANILAAEEALDVKIDSDKVLELESLVYESNLDQE